MSIFQQAKLFLMESTDLAKDALHVHVALVLFLGACLLFGWKARQWKPWLLVLLAALVGEAWDIRDSLADDDPLKFSGNWKDLWNTMVLPTVLLLAARYTNLFDKPEVPADDDPVKDDGESGDEAQLRAAALGGERDVL